MKKISIVIFFSVFLVLFALRLFGMGRVGTSNNLLFYGSVSDFMLTERSGKSISGQDLKGKVWIADVIFTRCAGQCPMMSGKMQKLVQQLPQATFVSFTTDPDYDTPQVLSTYAGWYRADPRRWLFLTGSKDSLSAVTTSFKMNKVDDPVMHSSSFVLVDKEGKLRGFYEANDSAAMERLMKEARLLLKERGSKRTVRLTSIA